MYHSRYKPSDLYIEQKYQSLKEEMLEYDHLNHEQIEEELIPKAKEYCKTNYTKSIKAKGDKSLHRIPPHYGIVAGSCISLQHVISVILYTDYTDLSKDFSTTFRKIQQYEIFESVKQRNQKYWWMSKLLRETVEIFGDNSYEETLTGPFYSGLSVVINVSNFFPRLSGPTSTSTHLEVAIKFGGDAGLVLQLNNPVTNVNCQKLRGFDCSIFSRYKDEEERYVCFALFFSIDI